MVLKFYTKTITTKIKGIKIPKMLGVIEGPVNKMIKAYPDEFSFMRHETIEILDLVKKVQMRSAKSLKAKGNIYKMLS